MSADSAFKKSDDEGTLEIEVTLEGAGAELSSEETGVQPVAATGEESYELTELPVSLTLKEFRKTLEYFVASVGDDITAEEASGLYNPITEKMERLVKPNDEQDLRLSFISDQGVFEVWSSVRATKRIRSKILAVLEGFRSQEMEKNLARPKQKREIFIYTQS